MATKLTRLMEKTLISDADLARKAEIATNTVKRAKENPDNVRMTTRRKLLDGLNKLLKERGEPEVKADIFR